MSFEDTTIQIRSGFNRIGSGFKRIESGFNRIRFGFNRKRIPRIEDDDIVLGSVKKLDFEKRNPVSRSFFGPNELRQFLVGGLNVCCGMSFKMRPK
jgi:hypothetical protein